MTFSEYRQLYEREKLGHLAPRTQDEIIRVLDEFQRMAVAPQIENIEAKHVARYINWQFGLTGKKARTPATIHKHLRKLLAAINWACSQGIRDERLIYKDDRLKLKVIQDEHEENRGRPLTEPEFGRLLDAAAIVRPNDYSVWARFLGAARWCDLRPSEALRLSWEPESPVRMMMLGDRPHIRFATRRSQKNKRVKNHPVHQQFWDVVKISDKGEEAPQNGFVFPLLGSDEPHIQRCDRGVYGIVDAIAYRAGIVVNTTTGKHATLYDIGRRTFVNTLIGQGVKPYDLMRLVRHESIDTTMKHYAHVDMQELASKHLGWNDE